MGSDVRAAVGAHILAATAPTTAFVASADYERCVVGRWSAVAIDPNDAADDPLPVQFETEDFMFHFRNGATSIKNAKSAGAHLEYVWVQFIGRPRFPELNHGVADKAKANVYVGAHYGLSGGRRIWL